ncbi:MAG: chromate resistance protein ChrB domain-containing protein [Pseudomonadota bacterium]
MPAPHEIQPKQLLRLIGIPACPVIVDVCTPEDHAADPVVVPTALRHSHADLPGLVARLSGRPSLIVCQKGKKLSQGVAAWLRSEGLRSEYLSGGMVGWRATPAAPVIYRDAIPATTNGTTLWVTRHRPKIDRIACPWLIRRFVDPGARFLYVAPDEVLAVAERLGGTAFDVQGAPFAHRDGCSFDTLLDHFGLELPALQTMADVVRAADLGRPTDHPAAPGLLALSIGLSRMYREDQEQLTAALPFYDALYSWARDGQDETHSSNPQERA